MPNLLVKAEKDILNERVGSDTYFLNQLLTTKCDH